MDMIDFKEWMPTKPMAHINARTTWGNRKIMYDPFFEGFIFTDCTHPWQNMLCSPFDIIEWEYVDSENMDELLIRKSWVGEYLRKKQAEEILASIKVTWMDRILFAIKRLLKIQP